ncbi:DUF500-domain-containing protein [Whalleya microplaca]|nr:DUF500-domain-containing protein [Whalleya microplaca]
MSAHPAHSPVPGDNPNYYSETAELPGDSPQPPPHPLQSHPVGSPSTSTSANAQAQQSQQYPPPPPGPPPTTTTGNTSEQPYFPPPPPGPPPISITQHDHAEYVPPANPEHTQTYYPPPPPGPPPNQNQAHSEQPYFPPPPSYTEQDAAGAAAAGALGDQKPPALPPRPGSASAQVPQFAPPPTEAGSASSHYTTTAAAAAAATPGQAGQEASPSSKHHGFGRKFYEWSNKVSGPINKLTNKLGSEAFWPTSLDKECDKAARILKSFCKDGFYTTSTSPATTTPSSPTHPTAPTQAPTPGPRPASPGVGPTNKPKVLVKIPSSAIASAKGLAIFTTFRTGFHISGAGGSGIVIARRADGRGWSPPAGFLVHTLGAGLMAGLDIYDCVCILRTDEAVAAFARPRLSLGGEVGVAAGPVGAGAAVDAAIGGKGGRPVWSYIKSRGLFGGVQVDGTVVVQRPDANAAFYGVDRISVDAILRGEVPQTGGVAKDGTVRWPDGARMLNEVLKVAEGRGKEADPAVLKEVGEGPTPGDLAPAEGNVNVQGYGREETKGEKVRFA